MEETVEELNTMCTVESTGEIFDCHLTLLPNVGQRLQIGKRTFYVTEAHDSVSPQFKFVITLRRG